MTSPATRRAHMRWNQKMHRLRRVARLGIEAVRAEERARAQRSRDRKKEREKSGP